MAFQRFCDEAEKLRVSIEEQARQGSAQYALDALEEFQSWIKPGKYLAATSSDTKESEGEGREEHDSEEESNQNLFVSDDDKDEDSDVEYQERPALDQEVLPTLGPGELWINRIPVAVHDWLGPERTDMINALHSVRPLPPLPHTSKTRFEWQTLASAKIRAACDSPMRGVIDMDEMGLGKTLSAIDACLYAGTSNKPGFNLVVTTRSCVRQWVDETQYSFEPGHRPRIFVLNNPKVMACELLAGDYDFVITTYGFIMHQYQTMCRYKSFWNDVRRTSFQEAKKSFEKRGHSARRPVLSLFSGVYKDLNIPIRHLILDEVQFLKNFNGKNHMAIKALHYKAVIMLSGTPFGNRWTDIFGIIDLLPNEPLRTLKDFYRIFATTEDNRSRNPTESQQARLVKYLMSFSFGRPSAGLLSLPDMEREDWTFSLKKENSDAVIRFVGKFYNMVARRGRSTDDKAVMAHATRAQQMACNPVLIKIRPSDQEQIVRDTAQALRDMFRDDVRLYEGNATAQRPSWAENSDILQDNMSANFMNNFVNWQIWRAKQLKKENMNKPATCKDHKKQKPIRAPKNDNEMIWEQEYDLNAGLPDEALNAYDLDDREIDEDDDQIDDQGYHEPNEQSAKRGEKSVDEDRRWRLELKTMPNNVLLSERVLAFVALFDHISRNWPSEKIVIWSRYLKFLDIIGEVLLREKGIQALRFDGRLDDDDRTLVQERFASPQSKDPLLITLGAGGAGLNVTAGSVVVFCEAWWNKQDIFQAERRCHRHGQTHPVKIFTLFAMNSAIDVVVRSGSIRKLSTINELMEQLRRPDTEPPTIPFITKMYGGFGYKMDT